MVNVRTNVITMPKAGCLETTFPNILELVGDGQNRVFTLSDAEGVGAPELFLYSPQLGTRKLATALRVPISGHGYVREQLAENGEVDVLVSCSAIPEKSPWACENGCAIFPGASKEARPFFVDHDCSCVAWSPKHRTAAWLQDDHLMLQREIGKTKGVPLPK